MSSFRISTLRYQNRSLGDHGFKQLVRGGDGIIGVGRVCEAHNGVCRKGARDDLLGRKTAQKGYAGPPRTPHFELPYVCGFSDTGQDQLDARHLSHDFGEF